MKVPGKKYLEKAEETGNRAEVPMTQGLGLVDLLKRTGEEVSNDHLFAYAGNLSYKALFALFPLFTLLISLLVIISKLLCSGIIFLVPERRGADVQELNRAKAASDHLASAR